MFPRVSALLMAVALALAPVTSACSKHKDAPAGVTPGLQVPDRIVQELKKSGAMAGDDILLAYFDYTVTLDGTEIAAVTRDRVLYEKDRRVTAFKLADVEEITTHEEALIGDVFEIKDTVGQRLKIEIAAFNGGALFASILEDAWKKKKPGASIRRVAKKG